MCRSAPPEINSLGRVFTLLLSTSIRDCLRMISIPVDGDLLTFSISLRRCIFFLHFYSGLLAHDFYSVDGELLTFSICLRRCIFFVTKFLSVGVSLRVVCSSFFTLQCCIVWGRLITFLFSLCCRIIMKKFISSPAAVFCVIRFLVLG